MNSVSIYTDGASSGNPGPGGYAAVIVEGRRRREVSGGFRLTTNNRMELYAVIAGLESLPEGSVVRVFSDSQYLVENLRQGRVDAWRSRGWRKTKKEAVPNADLWRRLLDLLESRRVTFEWVEGHAGDPLNERANRLAQQALLGANLPEDEGYGQAASGADVYQAELFDAAEVHKLGHGPIAEKPTSGYVASGAKVTRAGQPCRKCGAAVESRTPSRKVKPGQKYFYEYYLQCPHCGTIYFVEQAMRMLGNEKKGGI